MSAHTEGSGLEVVTRRSKRSVFLHSGVRICPQETISEVLANHQAYYQLRGTSHRLHTEPLNLSPLQGSAAFVLQTGCHVSEVCCRNLLHIIEQQLSNKHLQVWLVLLGWFCLFSPVGLDPAGVCLLMVMDAEL